MAIKTYKHRYVNMSLVGGQSHRRQADSTDNVWLQVGYLMLKEADPSIPHTATYTLFAGRATARNVGLPLPRRDRLGCTNVWGTYKACLATRPKYARAFFRPRMRISTSSLLLYT